MTDLDGRSVRRRPDNATRSVGPVYRMIRTRSAPVLCGFLTVLLTVQEIRATPSLQVCPPNLCENGGTCIGHVVQHYCVCLPGFTGLSCEQYINEKHGSMCVEAYHTDTVPPTRSTDQLSLRCPSDYVIHVIDSYSARKAGGLTSGLTSTTQCSGTDTDTCRQSWDRHRVQRSCEGQRQCQVDVDFIVTSCPSGQFYVRVNYTCLDVKMVFNVCDSSTRNMTLYIASAGYPQAYRNKMACRCDISAGGGAQVRVQVYDIDMEEDRGCAYNWLELNNSPTPQIDSVERRVCNASENVDYDRLYTSFSEQSSLSLTTVTGTNVHHRKGFFLRLDAVGGRSSTSNLKVTCKVIAYPDIPVRPTVLEPGTTSTTQRPVTSSPSTGPTRPVTNTASTGPRGPGTETVTSSNSIKNGETSSNAGLIGGVVAGVLFFALLVVVILFLWRRYQPLKDNTKPPNPQIARPVSDEDNRYRTLEGLPPYEVPQSRPSSYRQAYEIPQGGWLPAGTCTTPQEVVYDEHTYESIPYDNMAARPLPNTPGGGACTNPSYNTTATENIPVKIHDGHHISEPYTALQHGQANTSGGEVYTGLQTQPLEGAPYLELMADSGNLTDNSSYTRLSATQPNTSVGT